MAVAFGPSRPVVDCGQFAGHLWTIIAVARGRHKVKGERGKQGDVTMARKLSLYPDPVLRRRAEPVERIDEELRTIADEMVETLVYRSGYGLAAPQVGVLKRLIVVDVEGDLYVLANPRIVEASEETELGVEGCLSIPGVEAEVERPRRAVVEGLTLQGEEIRVEAEELLARVFLHEVDHLNGVLFIDHLGRVRRQRLLQEYEKARKEGAAEERGPAARQTVRI